MAAVLLCCSATAGFAQTFTFTDDPLTPGVTSIKAVHIAELRQAVNTLRSRHALPPFSFTDPALSEQISPIRIIHITELRTALDEVFDVFGRAHPNYTDPTIDAGVLVVKALHVAEIRHAVKTADLLPGTLHFAVTTPAVATAGIGFTVTLTALDELNSTVTSYAGIVHFTSSDSTAVLPADATLSNGIGTFSATLRAAGMQTLTATDTVFSDMTGTSSAITVNPGTAASFVVVAGAVQTAGRR